MRRHVGGLEGERERRWKRGGGGRAAKRCGEAGRLSQ